MYKAKNELPGKYKQKKLPGM